MKVVVVVYILLMGGAFGCFDVCERLHILLRCM